MSKSKSIGSAQATRPSTDSKDARRRGPIDVGMIQNVFLMYLNANIDENSSDFQNTISHLCDSVNTIQTFTDDRECFDFLENMPDEKAHMVVSGARHQQIVPRVHDSSQMDFIFIFCDNKKYHEGWAQD